MHDAHELNRLNRRRALQVIGMGVSAMGGLLATAGCKSEAPPPAAKPVEKPVEKPAEPAAAGCPGQEAIDEGSQNLRKALQYVEVSPQAGKACTGCAQFEAGKYQTCGGCKLFAGPVAPAGYCLSFAPLNPT